MRPNGSARVGILGRALLLLGLPLGAASSAGAEVAVTLLDAVGTEATFPGVEGSPATIEVRAVGQTGRRIPPLIRLNGRVLCRACGLRTMTVVQEQNTLSLEFRRPPTFVSIKVTQRVAAEAAAVIGREGSDGPLEVTDTSSPLHGVGLDVPPGALDRDTVVAIALAGASPSPPQGSEVTTPLVRIHPTGLQLTRPARLRLPLLDALDSRPSITWSLAESTLEWVPMGLHSFRNGALDAQVEFFALTLGATSPQATVPGGKLTVLAQPELFNNIGEAETLWCGTLAPRGVTYLAANAGAIDPHGESLLSINHQCAINWRFELKELAERHLAADPSTTVLLWLNANETEPPCDPTNPDQCPPCDAGKPAMDVDAILLNDAMRDKLATQASELVFNLFKDAGTEVRARIAVFFDVEPASGGPGHEARVEGYKKLLQRTRYRLDANHFRQVKIAVYPMKFGDAGEWFWTRSQFLDVASVADLLLYGAYDYGDSVVDAREYRARVMADVTVLGSLGLASKSVVLVNTKYPSPTTPHHDPERFVDGVAGALHSPYAGQLKGLGFFQLWGAPTEDGPPPQGRDPHDAEWCVLDAALSPQPLLRQQDCPADTGEVPGGMSHWWPFDGNADDFAGVRHGRNYGATPTRGHAGGANTALHFDGSDYIDMGGVYPPVTGFSVSFWMKPAVHQTTTGYRGENQIMGNAAGNRGFRFHQEGTSLLFQCQGQSGNGSGGLFVLTPADVDQWTHIVGVYNGHRADLYRDGRLVMSGLDRPTMDQAIRAFQVGRDVNLQTSYWRGDLDEIRIYPRALTAEEVGRLTRARSTCQE